MARPKHTYPVSMRRTNMGLKPHIWFDIGRKVWKCHSVQHHASGTSQRAAYKKWARAIAILEPKSRFNTNWFSAK